MMDQNNILSDYMINRNTLALCPAYAMNCQTIVLEGDRTFYVNQTMMQLLKASCLEGGADYDGRR